MATDAGAAPARPETALPYVARLLLTIVLLTLYGFARRIPLPGVDMMAVLEFAGAAQSPQTERSATVLALGFSPLMIGFILVELFSLLTSRGRHLRMDRGAGRARLNRAALITSLLLAAVQALGIGMFLSRVTAPGGAPLVSNPGWAFTLIATATLTSVTAAVFFLGNAISEYGIGNGFALLFVVPWAVSVVQSSVLLGVDGFGGSLAAGAGLLGAALLLGLLVRFFREADAARIPAFPQSLLPAQFFSMVFSGVVLGMSILGLPRIPWDLAWAQPVGGLILIPLLSWVGFHLFSSRPRLAASLPETDEVVDSLALTLRRRLLPSTVLLTLGATAFLAWSNFLPETFVAGLDFARLVMAVAIVLDVKDQFVFLRRARSTARLVQLDDVHVAYRLLARLRDEKIEPMARALRFRSLYFFLIPLVKIDVLVPQKDLGRSRQILAELEVAREIKAF